jgi:hypothetical protein
LVTAFHDEPDVTATGGELTGVVQDVADDLSQSGWVRIQVHGRVWQRNGQFLVPSVRDRADGVHDVVNDGRQLHPLSAKVNLAQTDAPGIKKTVDQPDHMADLPLKHI